jgi:hypothetical protein
LVGNLTDSMQEPILGFLFNLGHIAKEFHFLIKLLGLLVQNFVSLVKLNSFLVNLLVSIEHKSSLLIQKNGLVIKLLILSI